MRRATGPLLEEIASFENLWRAFGRAARGKRHRSSVDAFSFDVDRELLRLRRELLDGSYRPGPLASFVIRDPKQRTIRAAPFRDRVLHHAVMDVLEPFFERWLDGDSYACRKGRGVDRALARAVELSRRSPWVLRSDIERCYDSIDHDRLLALLENRIGDARLLRLLGRIVRHGGAGDGKGLPIGSLTSQWLANLYLGELDRLVRERLRPAGYARYMDDFMILSGDREELKHTRGELSAWLGTHLALRLHPRLTAIHRTAQGWPFLGFRVSPEGLRLRRETWRRFRRRLGARWHDLERGLIQPEELAASAAAMIAHLDRAGSRALRRRAMRVAEV